MIEPIQLFKCLSDETRLYATLLIFSEKELCVCELMEALDESQPKISRHLAQLRNCGILSDARKSQWVYYSMSKKLPSWVNEVLQTMLNANLNSLSRFQKNLALMKNRPNCC